MNAQFHTPSFGDEVFDLTDIDYNNSANSNSTPTNFQQQQQQSKRMRGSMDNSVDEYHSANDESFNSAAQIASPTTPTATATVAARKQLTTNDTSEPAKPLSAYALFFRDTVSAIKQQNPNCSFQELSRIVASMWEALDPTHKNVYNKKNELAKNEYIKQMRIFRQQQQQLLEQQRLEHATTPVLQSKPAVFTIPNHSVTSPQQQQQPQQVQPQSQYQPQQTQYQQQFEVQPQQQEQYTNQQEQAEQQQKTNTSNNDVDSQPPAQQIQMLTEAGSVQKCIRESCSKRAIINPDWEDEYCSNECVVIHCRNVFSVWVQSNLDARTQ